MKTTILLAALIATTVNATEVQWAQGFSANCTNATERTDGSILNATEISVVKYRIRDLNGLLVYEAIMAGGCRTTFIDTKQFVPVGNYLAHGITVDTDGLESIESTPGTSLVIMKSRPKPPSGVQ